MAGQKNRRKMNPETAVYSTYSLLGNFSFTRVLRKWKTSQRSLGHSAADFMIESKATSQKVVKFFQFLARSSFFSSRVGSTSHDLLKLTISLIMGWITPFR